MTRPTLPFTDGRRLDGIQVLIVDDTPDVLEVLTEVLDQTPATVTAVGSAEEALAALQWERRHVLLSDLAMPGKGGYRLIGQVRKRSILRAGRGACLRLISDM